MANPSAHKRDLIEGRPALIVIDIQASTFIDSREVRAISRTIFVGLLKTVSPAPVRMLMNLLCGPWKICRQELADP